MNNEQREIEAKFYLTHLSELRQKLVDRGAVLVQERTFEQNWRFDDLQGRLQAENIVLRLRQDAQARMTYKRVLSSTSYEKYRETFQLEENQIMLDELPFGCFAEIEGPDVECVRAAAARLSLDWARRVSRNYLGLFSLLKERKGWTFDDLSFERFASLPPILPNDLQVVDARIR